MVVLEQNKVQEINIQSHAYTQFFMVWTLCSKLHAYHHNTNETFTSKLSIPKNFPLDHKENQRQKHELQKMMATFMKKNGTNRDLKNRSKNPISIKKEAKKVKNAF